MSPRSRNLSFVAALTLASAAASAVTTTAHAAPAPSPAPVVTASMCGRPSGHHAACAGQYLAAPGTDAKVDKKGHEISSPNAANATSATVAGFAPQDIRSAYNLQYSFGFGRTVAIVDAYGYTNLEADLAAYRAEFGLDACTRANGCLQVLGQDGGSTLPAPDPAWAFETALDVDAVSATCPDCRIVVVEANSDDMEDLGKAAQTAAGLPGVIAISNSYGAGDLADSQYGHYYDHPGQAVVASTGDWGYDGPEYPAASEFVTAVGGTTLTAKPGSPRPWAETTWSGAGSGCSTQNRSPLAQMSVSTGCNGRAMADVAAVADPHTGLAVRYAGQWGVAGGTSLAAPIIASVYAMSGFTPGEANNLPYLAPWALNDVTSGSNGSCPSICTARPGWDGPTGLGTPNGTWAF